MIRHRSPVLTFDRRLDRDLQEVVTMIDEECGEVATPTKEES
jgi:hypothetical protein